MITSFLFIGGPCHLTTNDNYLYFDCQNILSAIQFLIKRAV